MAEIPVEKKEKGGFPWWLIPLLLLLLLLPLLYFCTRDTANTNTNTNTNANRAGATSTANNSNGSALSNAGGTSGAGNTAIVTNANGSAGASANGAMSNTGAASGGAAVTDVNMFGTTTDKSTLVGRNSTLSSVRVERVLSDKVFTVKSGAGEMFVMLDDNLDSSGGKEKQIKMQAGQTVNIGGAFRTVPTGEVQSEAKGGGLNQKEYAQMKGQNVYLHATSVSDVK